MKHSSTPCEWINGGANSHGESLEYPPPPPPTLFGRLSMEIVVLFNLFLHQTVLLMTIQI